MKNNSIYNIEIEKIGDQDTWVSLVSETNKVHYVEDISTKICTSYTSIDYTVENSDYDEEMEDLPGNYYVPIMFVDGKILDLISKIELNGEEYSLTNLIDDNTEEYITLDQEINGHPLAMILPKSGNIKFYLKYTQSIGLVVNFLENCVIHIDQFGATIPNFPIGDASGRYTFNFDSKATLKLIYYTSYAPYDGMYRLCATSKNIYINGVDTGVNEYNVWGEDYISIYGEAR